MADVEGLSPEELEAQGATVEAAVAAALALVAGQAAASVLAGIPAVIGTGLPAYPWVSLDDVAIIPSLWLRQLDEQVMPAVRAVFDQTQDHVRGQIQAAVDTDPTLYGTPEFDLPGERPPLVVPEIPDVTAEQLMAAARNRLVGIGDTLWADVRQQIVEGIAAGESIEQLAKRIEATAGVAEPRARTIARTEVVSTSNATAITQARSAGVPMRKIWLATEDIRTRLWHVEADGIMVPLDQTFTVGPDELDFPGDPTGSPSNVINCFPGDVVAQSVGSLKRIYRRWYEGDLIVINTASGIELSGTPNHPVFTSSGWKPLKSVDVGDELFKSVFTQGVGLCDPKVGDVPAKLSEMYAAASQSCVLQRAIGRSMDFHGDGAAGEVQIVSIDGNLTLPTRSEFADQVFDRIAVAKANMPGLDELRSTRGDEMTSDFGKRAAWLPACSVGLGRKSLSILESQLAHADEIGFAAASDWDTKLSHSIGDELPANPHDPGDPKYGGSVIQQAPELGYVDLLAPVEPGTGLLHVDASTVQVKPDGWDSPSDVLSYIGQGGTVQIQADHVVQKSIRKFSGHVYNLETETGMFIANSLAVSNCRCGIGFELGIPEPVVAAVGRKTAADPYVRDAEGQFAKTGTPSTDSGSTKIKDITEQLNTLAERARAPRDTVMRITDKQAKRALSDKDRSDKELAEAELESLTREGKKLAEEQLTLIGGRDGEPWGGYEEMGGGDEPFTVPVPSADRAKVNAARQEYVRDDKKTIRLNGSIRSGNPSAEAVAWRSRMNDMTSSETVGGDTVVYRGAALSPEVVGQMRSGAVFTDLGIVSTDVDASLAEHYGSVRADRLPGTLNTVFAIRVPRGTPGFDADYGEFVFGSDRRFRVIGSRRNDGGPIEVAVEMIPEGGE